MCLFNDQCESFQTLQAGNSRGSAWALGANDALELEFFEHSSRVETHFARQAIITLHTVGPVLAFKFAC